MNIKQPGDILFFKMAATISPKSLLANVGLDLLEEKLPESMGRGLQETRQAPSRLKETARSWFNPFLPAKKEQEPTMTFTQTELQGMINEILANKEYDLPEYPQLGLPAVDPVDFPDSGPVDPVNPSFFIGDLSPSEIEKTSSQIEDQPIKSEEDLVTAMKRMSLQLAKYTPKMKYRQTASKDPFNGGNTRDRASDFYTDDETMTMGPPFVLTPPFIQI